MEKWNGYPVVGQTAEATVGIGYNGRPHLVLPGTPVLKTTPLHTWGGAWFAPPACNYTYECGVMVNASPPRPNGNPTFTEGWRWQQRAVVRTAQWIVHRFGRPTLPPCENCTKRAGTHLDELPLLTGEQIAR